MKNGTLKAALLSVLAAIPLLSGCSATREIVEPSAEQLMSAGSGPAFPDRRLCLVVGPATQRVDAGIGGTSTNPIGGDTRNSLVEGLAQALKESFKSLDVVEDARHARKTRCELIAVSDVEYFTHGNRGQYDIYRIKLAFEDRSGDPVDSVKAEGKSMDFQDFGYGLNPGDTQRRALERSLKFLKIALKRSEALAKFVPGAAPAPEPVARPVIAAIEAAPAPSYRADAETPAFSRPEDETKFAVIVGVEKYSDLPPAEHAVRDARAMKAHLLALGYPERNIIFLTDQKALKTGLEKYVESWLPRNVDANSTVFFYFSGHGAPDPVTGQAYLVPWDGDPKFIDTTGYPVKRLYAKLNALKAKKILVAMDSCFSGVGGRSVIAIGTRPLVGKVDMGGAVAGRVAALTASASDEISGIDEASGHGLFTYQLLKALDARHGKATMKELFNALSPKVRDAARRDNRDQTPQLIGDGAASL
jgi:hypothetical protein